MDKKKILIITRAFYPENSPRSFRATELAKEFSRQGHNVIVLTPRDTPGHDIFEREHNVRIKPLGPLTWPSIDFTRGGKAWILVKRLIRKLLLVFFDYPNIEVMFKTRAAIQEEADYDLMISIAVPHPIHWGVAWGWKNLHPVAKTWVADCGDPFMGVEYDRFGKMFYFKYLEKWFCKKADYITVPLEEAKEAYYPEFRNKIRVIPQGFKFEEYLQDRSQYRPNSVPTFAFAGALMKGIRDPSALLEYLVSLEQDFKFYIYTRMSGIIEPYLKRSRGRIIVHGFIPREELLKILSTMDFLVNINNITNQQVPSKLIDYYFTRRPVLTLETGKIAPPIIDQFLDGDYQAKHVFENMDKFRIEQVTSQFLKLHST